LFTALFLKVITIALRGIWLSLH